MTPHSAHQSHEFTNNSPSDDDHDDNDRLNNNTSIPDSTTGTESEQPSSTPSSYWNHQHLPTLEPTTPIPQQKDDASSSSKNGGIMTFSQLIQRKKQTSSSSATMSVTSSSSTLMDYLSTPLLPPLVITDTDVSASEELDSNHGASKEEEEEEEEIIIPVSTSQNENDNDHVNMTVEGTMDNVNDESTAVLPVIDVIDEKDALALVQTQSEAAVDVYNEDVSSNVNIDAQKEEQQEDGERIPQANGTLAPSSVAIADVDQESHVVHTEQIKHIDTAPVVNKTTLIQPKPQVQQQAVVTEPLLNTSESNEMYISAPTSRVTSFQNIAAIDPTNVNANVNVNANTTTSTTPNNSSSMNDTTPQILMMQNHPQYAQQLMASQLQQQQQPSQPNMYGIPPSAFSIPNPSPPQLSPQQQQQQQQQQRRPSTNQQPTRRAIKLQLYEEIKPTTKEVSHNRKGSRSKKLFSKILTSTTRQERSDSLGLGQVDDLDVVDVDGRDSTSSITNNNDGVGGSGVKNVYHGEISVSWYEGTTTTELKKHVRKSMLRKLDLAQSMIIEDIRFMDESVEPNEEIVLSPYIPHGSSFLLKFRVRDTSEKYERYYTDGAPASPSAAPSPYTDPRELGKLQHELGRVISSGSRSKNRRGTGDHHQQQRQSHYDAPPSPPLVSSSRSGGGGGKTLSLEKDDGRRQPVEIEPSKLAEISTTLSQDSKQSDSDQDDDLEERIDEFFRKKIGYEAYRPVEKKQVVFMIANYFVLFLSIIAISAEIHERAPGWIEWLDQNVSSVRDCAADRDALFECVQSGDFSGLVASIIIWATQSVATKPIFLFGFESSTKLWTVVYEALVTAVCWGTSYICIRRGLNPDTRTDFLHKYWKDAVYGSLAGFNAAFMKAVLKNLIPQDEVLNVLETRQLRIVSFLGNLLKNHDV